MTDFVQRLEQVRNRIAAAAEAAGRSPSEVSLLAVSKRHPRESILEAQAAGLVDFGENYVQEALEKFPVNGTRLHFIGPLQRNKIRKLLPVTSLIHGVATQPVLEAIQRISQETDVVSDILLQLHLTDEPTKSGFTPDEFQELLPICQDLTNVRIRGIMCMGPLEGGPDAARPAFALARQMLDLLRTAVPDANTLSMGMSDDLEVAIAEGSTMVRVGTALFGNRS